MAEARPAAACCGLQRQHSHVAGSSGADSSGEAWPVWPALDWRGLVFRSMARPPCFGMPCNGFERLARQWQPCIALADRARASAGLARQRCRGEQGRGTAGDGTASTVCNGGQGQRCRVGSGNPSVCLGLSRQPPRGRARSGLRRRVRECWGRHGAALPRDGRKKENRFLLVLDKVLVRAMVLEQTRYFFANCLGILGLIRRGGIFSGKSS